MSSSATPKTAGPMDDYVPARFRSPHRMTPHEVDDPREVVFDRPALADIKSLPSAITKALHERMVEVQHGDVVPEPKQRELDGVYTVRLTPKWRAAIYLGADNKWHCFWVGPHNYEEATHRWVHSLRRTAAPRGMDLAEVYSRTDRIRKSVEKISHRQAEDLLRRVLADEGYQMAGAAKVSLTEGSRSYVGFSGDLLLMDDEYTPVVYLSRLSMNSLILLHEAAHLLWLGGYAGQPERQDKEQVHDARWFDIWHRLVVKYGVGNTAMLFDKTFEISGTNPTFEKIFPLVMRGSSAAPDPLRVVAFPSWRDRGAHPEGVEAVIAPDLGRARRNSYVVYLYGEIFSISPTLRQAKAGVEEIYGPLTWSRVPGDAMLHHDNVWGDTAMFNDAPFFYVIQRLPRLGVVASASRALYHGTSKASAKAILADGPRAGLNLTRNIDAARQYARNESGGNAWTTDKREQGAVLGVRVSADEVKVGEYGPDHNFVTDHKVTIIDLPPSRVRLAPAKTASSTIDTAFASKWGRVLTDPALARDRCIEVSEDYARTLTAAGRTDVEVVSGMEFGEAPEFPGVRLLLNGHFATRVGTEVWDWTARQFDPASPVPLIQSLVEWRTRWTESGKTATIGTATEHYRGVGIWLHPQDPRSIALLRALSTGAESVARDRLVELIGGGSGVNHWDGSRNRANPGTGRWWTTDYSAAFQYGVSASRQNSDGRHDGMGFHATYSAILTPADDAHEDGNGHVWPVLAEGDPLTLVSIEAFLPTQSGAKRMLDLAASQGGWTDPRGAREGFEDLYEVEERKYVFPVNMRTQASGRALASAGEFSGQGIYEVNLGPSLDGCVAFYIEAMGTLFPIAWLTWERATRKIEGVFVSKAQRGLGIGAAMLAAAEVVAHGPLKDSGEHTPEGLAWAQRRGLSPVAGTETSTSDMARMNARMTEVLMGGHDIVRLLD